MPLLLVRPSRLALLLIVLVYGSAALAILVSELSASTQILVLTVVIAHGLEYLHNGRQRPQKLRPGAECWYLQGRATEMRYPPPRPLFVSAALIVLEFSDNRGSRLRLVLFADSLSEHDDWLLRCQLSDLQRLEIRREAGSG